MEFTAKQIAELIQGRVEGDEKATVNTFAKIEEGVPGAISFLSNPKYTHFIYDTQSSIVLINDDVALEHPVKPTLIRVKNAYESVAQLLQFYESMKPRKTGIDPLAFISQSARVADDAYVGAFACIGDGAKVGKGSQIYPHAVIGDGVCLGENCTVYPNVCIYQGCQVGNNVTIHAGTVIGADGFGFAPNQEGYAKIPQIGIVVIEDDVEIGANTCIDRSTMGKTVIRRGVKLDNLIQVAHNCEIGENTVMSAQAGLAGSTKVGSWCMVGGQAGFSGHIHVADKTFVGAQCGVIKSTKGNGETLIGSPAMEPKTFFKAKAIYPKLPDMYREVAQLRKEITILKSQISNQQDETEDTKG
ncbi:MAG: UDP-3-O-(3-hydroxymyristoyl)glucosamine N-acyltransferase [Prevotella sp.]|nr:UDP-3-O-(3-hydroxymyristoyl)glucosamine N-acyltransferase [Prevotella sp.]